MRVWIFLTHLFNFLFAWAVLIFFGSVALAISVGYLRHDRSKFGTFGQWFQNRAGKVFVAAWFIAMAYFLVKWRWFHWF